MIQLMQGDCLELMSDIPDGSVDMVLCDLPYGITSCKWDSVIPFEPLWDNYKRVIKKNGAIVLFGSQPFTSALVMSNPKWFRYEWMWNKSRITGVLNAKKMPIKKHENIIVFSSSTLPLYNPQGLVEVNELVKQGSSSENFGKRNRVSYVKTHSGLPRSVLEFKSAGKTVHPTQKPVPLCEYLIKTYTNEGETVLDNCFGSGTTAIACLNTGRKFIGIEKDETYFNIAKNRIENAQKEVGGLL